MPFDLWPPYVDEILKPVPILSSKAITASGFSDLLNWNGGQNLELMLCLQTLIRFVLAAGN